MSFADRVCNQQRRAPAQGQWRSLWKVLLLYLAQARFSSSLWYPFPRPFDSPVYSITTSKSKKAQVPVLAAADATVATKLVQKDRFLEHAAEQGRFRLYHDIRIR